MKIWNFLKILIETESLYVQLFKNNGRSIVLPQEDQKI